MVLSVFFNDVFAVPSAKGTSFTILYLEHGKTSSHEAAAYQLHRDTGNTTFLWQCKASKPDA